MIEWLDPLAIVSVAVVSGGVGWVGRTASMRSHVESQGRLITEIRRDTAKRLDDQAEDLKRIEREFVSRRELEEKLQLYFRPLEMRIDGIRDSLAQQTRMLEYAVANKAPEWPSSLDKS